MRAPVLCATVLAVLYLPTAVDALEPGSVFGKIQDLSGRALADADILVQSAATGARWKTRSESDGGYAVPGLASGRYKVTVRLPGFRTVSRVGAVLEGRTGVRIDFAMELLGLQESITVTSGTDELNPAAASSLLVTRNSSGATLPANGGDYRVLFDLLPGVVTTPASTSDAGQFASGGQRPNSNTFRIDGVSANTGVGSSTLPGAFPGASLPAMNAIGSTESLVSNETAQSVELRTSDFSPEFGDRPGAEALINTRSGTDRFREELFGHWRNAGWSARDWFANSRRLDFPRPGYGRLGVVLGGHIRRNRTFYLLSAEDSQLRSTLTQITSVPSLAARQNAPEKLKDILSFYPLPDGPDLGSGQAEGFAASYQTGQLLTTSLRIDQSLGRHGNAFFRVVEAPSRSTNNSFNWGSVTAGLTAAGTHGIHDLRFNYSRADLLYSLFGGGPGFGEEVLGVAGLLPGFTLLPGGGVTFKQEGDDPASILQTVNSGETIFGLSVPGLGQFISYGPGKARQDQWEIRETYSRTLGRHELRIGADYIRLEPSRSAGQYAVLGAASSLQSLIDGDPLAVTASSLPQHGGKIHQGSAFAQDTFRVNERLSLLYGIVWDITPPTPVGNQVWAQAVSGLWDGSTWQSVGGADLSGTAPWPMRFGQVAPRFGLAYRLPVGGIVLRAGAGVFRDAALGATVNPINAAPFNSWLLSAGGSSIYTSGAGAGGTGAPSGATSPDVARFLAGVYPALRLPTSYQWRISLERPLGSHGVGSVAYVGSLGRNLLGHEAYEDPATGVPDRTVALTQNSSSYQALQTRYSGAVARNLYGSVSYTLGHSIDDGSLDSSVFLIHPGYRLGEARGSSSFDVRHAMTAALSYRFPREVGAAVLPVWMAGWTLSGTAHVRSGFPIDVLNTYEALGQSFDNFGRPNLVPGAAVWIEDSAAPGGRTLNPAAFSVPLNGAAGTLGRNAIYGNGLAQMDVSFRREFLLPWGISVEAALSVFNVLNHPAFADPVPFLASPLFGRSASMQNLMLGSGSPNTGLAPLFLTGGPRSAELSFRVCF